MPPITRGSIYWYDYGPIFGNELSERRPALVISNTSLNDILPVVLTLPITSAAPPARHQGNHVLLEGIGSWASVRQMKSVEKGRLGDKLGEASQQEMERVLEILVVRLFVTRSRPVTVETLSGLELLRAGTVWYVELRNQDGAIRHSHILILDCNAGNGMAIAVEVEYTQRPNSPVRIPISIEKSGEQASALIHRVRSIDVSARSFVRVSEVDEASLMTVKSALLSAIGQ